MGDVFYSILCAIYILWGTEAWISSLIFGIFPLVMAGKKGESPYGSI